MTVITVCDSWHRAREVVEMNPPFDV
ncbi:hypothetical protein A2U01_0080303, partial [Trifolium medium]|nr:hypothetical protein [Trifolium medium]